MALLLLLLFAEEEEGAEVVLQLPLPLLLREASEKEPLTTTAPSLRCTCRNPVNLLPPLEPLIVRLLLPLLPVGRRRKSIEPVYSSGPRLCR